MERQKSDNAEAVERNKQLIAEVADLKAGMAAIEERARSELGMIGRNETFYQVVPVRPRTALPRSPPRKRRPPRADLALSFAPMRYFVVIPAAGSGRRFSRPCPKQYAPLGASTVIEHALAPFETDPDCAGIVVAIAADDPWWPAIAARRSRLIEGVVGGEQRAHSVRNALRALASRARDDDWIMVHDAARPCFSGADLQLLKRELASHPVGGLLAVPLADTLKRALEPGAHVTHVDGTIDRDGAVARRDSAGVPLRCAAARARSRARCESHAHRRSPGHRMERSAAATGRRARG